MDTIGYISQIGTLIVALVGVGIALSQLRQANRDAHASRMAEMSWQVYQSYVEPRIRTARGAAEYIAHTTPLPNSGAEYGDKYADKAIDRDNLDEETLDTNMRRLLRFYNQVGILIERKLVDEVFVFALIGPGLNKTPPARNIRLFLKTHPAYRLMYNEPADNISIAQLTNEQFRTFLPRLRDTFLKPVSSYPDSTTFLKAEFPSARRADPLIFVMNKAGRIEFAGIIPNEI